MSNLFDLTGKVVVITGSGRGLGKAIALGVGAAGASVVVCSRTLSEAEATARSQEIRQRGVIEGLLGEGGGTSTDVFLAIRGIGQDEVELSAGGVELGNGEEDILSAKLKGTHGQPQGAGVFLNHTGMARGELGPVTDPCGHTCGRGWLPDRQCGPDNHLRGAQNRPSP